MKNALYMGAIISAILGPIIYVLSAVSHRSVSDSFKIVMGIFFIVCFFAFFLNRIITHTTSGTVLLDCGPNPNRMLFLLCSVVFGYFGFTDYYQNFVPEFMTFEFIDLIFAILFPALYLSLAFGRLQIREQGIWAYWGLLKWKNLKSFEWQGTDHCTLMVQSHGHFQFLRRGALPVPLEHKAKVEELINTYRIAEA
ncbi:MAG: hypothetical protein COA73_00325 [Candidatus Hydrogenedentota bacterium]|nr:MAG: hypothetical protein COA73_00325 [Candidatus Hydrogenedentota bacterium]